MRNPAVGLKVTPCSSGIALMLTSRFGVVISSFISESRSVPPASTSVSPQLLPSNAETCVLLVGVANSNGRIFTSRIQSRDNPLWCDGQKGHTHANRIGHRVG